jgi:hypothetical protein
MKHVVIDWTGTAVRWWTKKKEGKVNIVLGFFFLCTYSFSSSSNSLLIRFNAILGDELKV